MPAGRKPKPTHLKLADGNPGKRAINQDEPEPDPTPPDIPDYLDDVARDHWIEMSHLLEELGLLTKIDRDMFAAYCTAFSHWQEAEDFIKKNGPVYVVTNKVGEKVVKRFPQVSIASEALKRMQSLASEFGLTPSSRTRIQVTGEDINDAEDFLFGSG